MVPQVFEGMQGAATNMLYPKFYRAEFDNVILKVDCGTTSRFLLSRFVHKPVLISEQFFTGMKIE